MSQIVAENLVKKFGSGKHVTAAIQNISFQVDAGEFIGIMGESGAGKSTLLSILGAMSEPSSGKLAVDDIDVYSLRSDQRADFRREFLGFVFQRFHLVSYLTVVENVMLPLTTTRRNYREKCFMAQKALDWVGLKDKANRLPGEISGGEQERVAIARAIVNKPPVLLADEPTGNLDTRTSDEILALFQRLNEEGMTIIMVTHSMQCAGYAERILNVSDGKLATSGGEKAAFYAN